jgi:hypothetical protein
MNICRKSPQQHSLSISYREHGSEQVRDRIVDDIREAQWSGDKSNVDPTRLHHFLLTHPEARPSEHP